MTELSIILERVANRYGVDAQLHHELVEVDPGSRRVVLANRSEETEQRTSLECDLLHLMPPPSAPILGEGKSARRSGEPRRLIRRR